LYYGLPAVEQRNLAEALEAVVPTHPAVPYEHRLLSGDPAREIVRLADEEGVDMIILGTHGRTGLKRLLMGSVAEAVVRRAMCPVLTIKQPAEVAAHPE
jgi:nucleotide-binding universal stress UspA family protein